MTVEGEHVAGTAQSAWDIDPPGVRRRDGSRSEAAGPQEQDVRTLRSAKDTQLHALLDQSLAADNSSLSILPSIPSSLATRS